MEHDPYIVIDFETASACNLKASGAAAYAEHPSTIVQCLCVRSGTWSDTWVWGDPLPWWAHVACTVGVVVAFNTGFELSIWRHVLHHRCGWPDVPIDRWRDVAVLGRAKALPASLGGLAKAVGTAHKDTGEGAAVMREMCVATPRESGGWDYPGHKLKELVAYCAQDVLVTEQLWLRLRADVSEPDLRAIDTTINDRGVCVDLDFAAKMERAAHARKVLLAAKAFEASGAMVADAVSPAGLKRWLELRGVALPKMGLKDADGEVVVRETLNRQATRKIIAGADAPEDVRDVLKVRLEATKTTSLSKLSRLREMVSSDGRLRGLLRIYGAHTGRWTSHGLQLHNLARNRLGDVNTELARQIIDAEDHVALASVFHDPLGTLSQMLRSVIVAAPGHTLIGGDFAAIEARVVAWLAGQNDVVRFLHTFDAARARGEKPEDLYQFAARSIGSADRQLGKIAVLALGYGMGVKTFAETARAAGIELTLKKAREVQRAWRSANELIVEFWRELEDAATSSVSEAGYIHVGALEIDTVRDAKDGPICLRIRLPSGRMLHYWRPHVVQNVEKQIDDVDDDGNVVVRKIVGPELRYYAADSVGMRPTNLYGGLLAENVTQAVARDLLAAAVVRVEQAGYPVVMHVHDSIASEVPLGEGSEKTFGMLMSTVPSWAADLPVAVDTYRSPRFKG